MEHLGKLVGAFILVLYHVFLLGFVATKFYGWFVLPHFPNLPYFGYLEFTGFILFVSVLDYKTKTPMKDEYKDTMVEFMMVLLGPWVLLSIGWLVNVIIH